MRARIEQRKAARRRRRAQWGLAVTASLLGGLSAVGVTLFLLSGDATPPSVGAAPPPALVSSLTAIPTPIFEEVLPESPTIDEAATGTTGQETRVEPGAKQLLTRDIAPGLQPAAARPRAETTPPAPVPETSSPARTARYTPPPAPAMSQAPERLADRVPERVADRGRDSASDTVTEPRTREPEVVPVAEPDVARGAPAHVAVPVAAISSPPPSSPAPVVDPRAPVQHTIERYRTAYERLDADAARAVWPTVNRGALARAFSSLSAQQLTFDGCTIDVNGATARANCRGRTRVVPRVGGGTETARREWSFWLRQANGGWTIERAEVK